MAGDGKVINNVMNKMMLERLDRLEAQLLGMEDELSQVTAESLSYVERFKLLEAAGNRHEDELRKLNHSSGGMQKQFHQAVDKIDMLEMKLFNWIQQFTQDSIAERQTSQKDWMQFLQIVLGGTIFLIVAYLFSINFQD